MHKSTAKKLSAERAYPDKLFYKIGEVSKITGVEPYVLRYWETEFTFLKPRKSKSGQRIYIKKDLDLIFQIKQYLYEDRFTIEGVRKKLSEGGAPKQHIQQPAVSAEPGPKLSRDDAIEHVRKRLRHILDQLG